MAYLCVCFGITASAVETYLRTRSGERVTLPEVLEGCGGIPDERCCASACSDVDEGLTPFIVAHNQGCVCET